MAGKNPDFDATRVREALRFAMRMGSPNRRADKATFHFRGVTVWVKNGVVVENPRLDQDGNPFDPEIHAEVAYPDPVVLDEVAVEFSIAAPEELPVGNFRQTRVELTLLDEEWARVREAIEVSLQGGDRYYISYEKPVIGLFDMDVHQVVCYARDES